MYNSEIRYDSELIDVFNKFLHTESKKYIKNHQCVGTYLVREDNIAKFWFLDEERGHVDLIKVFGTDRIERFVFYDNYLGDTPNLKIKPIYKKSILKELKKFINKAL